MTVYRKFLGKNEPSSHLVSVIIEEKKNIYYSRPIYCNPNEFKDKLRIAMNELNEYIKNDK
jgi:hypothetical protein